MLWRSCKKCQQLFCRSVLAMRTLAHEQGAGIRPVRAHMQNKSCVLNCCADTVHCISLDRMHGRSIEQERATSPATTQIMLALPLECNVTGTRCSEDALDALCQGRVIVPHVSPDVRSLSPSAHVQHLTGVPLSGLPRSHSLHHTVPQN